MFRALIIAVFMVSPAKLLAHSWLEGEPALTRAQVESVVERVEDFDIEDVLNQPTKESSVEFFNEISVLMEDFSGETLRVLLLFEAIRQGAVDPSGQATEKFGWAFEDRISLRDFPTVSIYFERLDTWFAPLLQE